MAYEYFSDPQEKIVFLVDGPQPQSLFAEGEIKVIVAGLNAGPKIPVRPEGLSVYQFIEGTGTMVVDGERLQIKPGVVIITGEARHGSGNPVEVYDSENYGVVSLAKL